MACCPVTSWKTDGEKWKRLHILFSWALQSPRMVTAAMKLNETFSFEGKPWQT